jgi:4-alpha-glucanotransferase
VNTAPKSLLQTPAGHIWKSIGIHPHHGINVFLSALQSENSCGIGEFLDLLPVLHFCMNAGLGVIQLLPLNDSGYDPSPYNALSSVALNPVYLSLHCLPGLEDEKPECAALLEKLSSLKAYSLLPRVAYRDVLIAKIRWLKDYIDLFKEQLLSNQEFKLFKDGNPWVETYAMFKVLKDKFDHASWESWPNEYQKFDSNQRSSFIAEFKDSIDFFSLLQFLCFSQLKQIRNFADRHGLLLMGDIPILVSRDSVDVWNLPHLFELQFAAGAPPDIYSSEGQYWGFPLFNWEAIRLDDYRFWRERMRFANEFYHLYRIDHAVGFFKIWGIPIGEPGSRGHFIPADPAQWIPQGEHLLSMILASSSMLPIAEDLGAVTKEIRECLSRLGIPGTKVLRWMRNYDDHKEYLLFNQYPPLSLSCVSTHDSETLTLWWCDCKEEAEAFAQFKGWEYIPLLDDEKRLQILKDSHATTSLFHVNPLQEYFAFFPELVADDPNDERINIPGKFLPTNWTYKYHTPIELWSKHKQLQLVFKEVLTKK